MEGLPGDAEVLGGESSIFPSHRMVEHHPFHSQSFMGFKIEKIGYSPPGFIPISIDNRFPFKEIEAGWFSYPGNSCDMLASLNIPQVSPMYLSLRGGCGTYANLLNRGRFGSAFAKPGQDFPHHVGVVVLRH